MRNKNQVSGERRRELRGREEQRRRVGAARTATATWVEIRLVPKPMPPITQSILRRSFTHFLQHFSRYKTRAGSFCAGRTFWQAAIWF